MIRLFFSFGLGLLGYLYCWSAAASVVSEQAVIEQLIQQAKQDEQQMKRDDRQRLQQFKQQHKTQLQQLQQTERSVAQLKQQLSELEQRTTKNQQILRQQQLELQQERSKYQQLFNEIRHFGRQLVAQIESTHFYPFAQDWLTAVAQFTQQDKVVAASEVRALWLAYLEWIKLSAGFQQHTSTVIYPNGEEKQETVSYVGAFSLYAADQWLTYLPESQRLLLMSPQPRQFSVALLTPDKQGGLNVLIDPQHGKLMKQLTSQPTFWDELTAGGIVGGVIIALGVLAFGVALHRLIRLKQLARQNISLNQQQHSQLLQELNGLEKDLIEGRLTENLQLRGSVLQKGAGLISTVATVAPLLGLLGTVIGMIDTFQALMLYGNESPSVLSGGISKALVTTELGLVVAIPLVLLHSQLQAMAQRLQQSNEQFYLQVYVELLQRQKE